MFSRIRKCMSKGKPRVYRATDGYVPEDLLQFGIDHLEAALALGKGSLRHLDSAGYLAHLGLELVFKSWLLWENKEFPSTHSLRRLRQEVGKLERSFKLTKHQNKLLDYLDGMYELRYPNRNTPTQSGDEDLKFAAEITNTLWKRLPARLVTQYENIPKNRKGGRVLMRRPAGLPTDYDLLFSSRERKGKHNKPLKPTP